MLHSRVHLAAALSAMAMLAEAANTTKLVNNATPDDEEDTPKSPMMGLALAPSKYDIKVLAVKVQEAVDHEAGLIKNITNQLIESCEGEPETGISESEAKNIALATSAVKKAGFKVAKAKADLANGEYWYHMEKKRQKDLPSLVLKVQEQANKEYRLRVKAEEAATEAKRAAEVAEQAAAGKLEPYREAVAKQRFEDRLHAAQDVAIAKQAVEEAAQARKEKAAKKKADNMVDVARQTYDEMQKKVTLAATRSLKEKEKVYNEKVLEKTKAVIAETKKYHSTDKEAKKLRLKSVESAVSAQAARRKAIAARAAYDNVRRELGAVIKQANRAEDVVEEQSTAVSKLEPYMEAR